MGKKVLLINDTTYWYHFGCTATSKALKLAIEATGATLQAISITETYKIVGAPTTKDGFLNKDNFQSFVDANRDLMEAIRDNDILVINGEGTLHGLRQAPLSLLYIAFAAKKFLGKNVEIINHSVYPQDDLKLDKPEITEIYELVYNHIDYSAIREPESFNLMKRLGVPAVQSFDCMPFYIREKYKFHKTKDTRTLLVAGSAAWLHLNILSSERGNIDEFEDGLSGFIQYLHKMSEQGYRIEFLYGAAEHPAKDDREFMAFIEPRLSTSWTVIEAKSLDEWLGHIERANLLVSGRFHHTIAAACLGTNFIILNSNTPKVEGMAKVLGCGDVLNYRDPDIVEKLLVKTEEAEKGVLKQCDLGNLCSMSANNFNGLIDAQTEWYTEDRMREILNFFLEGDEYAVIAQTQFEHGDILTANINAAVGAAMAGQIAVMPINLHNNHWVGTVIRRQSTGEIQVIYIDPMGTDLDDESNADIFMDAIQSVTRELNPDYPTPIINILSIAQQTNGNDCGPFTLDNLINLARAQLDHLTPEQIAQYIHVPVTGEADILRIEHSEILNRGSIIESENLNSTSFNTEWQNIGSTRSQETGGSSSIVANTGNSSANFGTQPHIIDQGSGQEQGAALSGTAVCSDDGVIG